MIDDTYNASPDSMKASINVLCDMPCAGKRVAVLGDMFELGENEVLYHKEIGQFLLDKNVDEVILLGELSQNIKQVLEQSFKTGGCCIVKSIQRNEFEGDCKYTFVRIRQQFIYGKNRQCKVIR